MTNNEFVITTISDENCPTRWIFDKGFDLSESASEFFAQKTYSVIFESLAFQMVIFEISSPKSTLRRSRKYGCISCYIDVDLKIIRTASNRREILDMFLDTLLAEAHLLFPLNFKDFDSKKFIDDLTCFVKEEKTRFLTDFS